VDIEAVACVHNLQYKFSTQVCVCMCQPTNNSLSDEIAPLFCGPCERNLNKYAIQNPRNFVAFCPHINQPSDPDNVSEYKMTAYVSDLREDYLEQSTSEWWTKHQPKSAEHLQASL